MELANGRVVLHAGDCLEVLASLPENSIDAVVTDPPYHFASMVKRFGKPGQAPINNYDEKIGRNGPYQTASRGFMGKEWDGGDIAFRPETWALVWRVLKPGGHMVAFGAPKNYHRLACAIEDAGFEIRDSLMWVFGTGFPKSMDVSKAIDKAAGAEREKVAIGNPVKRMIPGADQDANGSWIKDNGREYQPGYEIPATDAARQWQGWGTALKPAYEPIVLARKPLSEGTVAANVLRWGTGALNIDSCRISLGENEKPYSYPNGAGGLYSHDYQQKSGIAKDWNKFSTKEDNKPVEGNSLGRWPANLCHDGSDEVLAGFPETKSGNVKPYKKSTRQLNCYGVQPETSTFEREGDEGSAARFFYSAKASKSDRAGSKHPTVKPVKLMQWLVRMITPPDGKVLDPFAGSGTTGVAAVEEGFHAILIERETEYQQDIANRFEKHKQEEAEAVPLLVGL